jgi:hypothetical protein
MMSTHLTAGNKVFGLDQGNYYPGKITTIGSGKCLIKWFDGANQGWVNDEHIIAFDSLQTGIPVHIHNRLEKLWYEALVREIDGEDILVQYTNGKQLWVGIDQLRIPGQQNVQQSMGGQEAQPEAMGFDQTQQGNPPQQTSSPQSPTEKSLDELIEEIGQLVGMDHIKEDISLLMDSIQMEKMRKEAGLPANEMTLHTVFAGPPGTGKTTIARKLGKIFKGMGILQKGHVVEVDRSKLVGEHIGHTAKITSQKLDEAMDGILFIDEAYSLSPDTPNDFGPEAIDTVLKRMEDERERLVVIVAGYKEEMDDFLRSNPGLKSRFNRYFEFRDYNGQQLLELFQLMLSQKHYLITEEASGKMLKYFNYVYETRDKSFGNGRLVRNKIEEVLKVQGARVISMIREASEEDKKRLMTEVTLDDIEKVVDGEYVEVF